MLILAMLDFFYKQVPLSSKARHGHILAAGFGIILLGIVAAGIYTAKDLRPPGWFGPYTILLIIVYIVAMRLIYFYEKKQIASFVKEVAQELRYKEIPAKDAVVYYAINAFVVVAAAIFLPKIGKGIAELTGLGQSFVGNVFIAMSTSLPEVVVSIAAVRIASIDLAIGNLLGSNIFNVFILAIDDLLYTKGPILSFISPEQMIAVFSGILMTAIVIIGLTYRAEKKRLLLAWDSIGIITVYVVNILLLYRLQ
jgi:cation:H+ antiporter